MGKVLSAFDNGSPGAVSRAVDEIVISIRNAGGEEIAFGSPVFIKSDRSGAVGWAGPESTQTFADFIGFAVRVPDKTPDAYPGGPFDPQPQGVWKAGDTMDVLVRGSVAVPVTGNARKAGKVYLRKADGVLTASAGAEGSTVELENVRIRNGLTGQGACAEVAVLRRNIQ